MEATQETELVDAPVVAQPEAGFSLNWQMVDGYNATVQVTMRTARIEDWPDVLQRRAAFMKLATDKGWGIPGRPAGVSPAPLTTTSSTVATKPASTNPQPPANGKAVETLLATKMEVTPKPDGKVELKFYGAGHKFPDIYANGSVENMVKLLAGNGDWTAEHLAAANTYDSEFTIRYTLSAKLNSKGNPYKDVLSIG